MPDSGQPISPNFVPGVGRLATDRYDFEAHILGTNFRQSADTVDVLLQNSPPGLEVNGHYYTNVLTALEALAAAAEPPVIAPATQTTLGTVQLTRDLGGTNGVSPKVVGLQGFPVSPQTPTVSQVLTWNGSSWIPSAVTGIFSPGGDLGGSSPASSNSLQYVASLSGSSGIVSISADELLFNSNVNFPSITQVALTSGNSTSLSIAAQGTNTGNGGTLFLQGGGSSFASPYLPGSTLININGQAALQLGQVVHGQNVAAFFAAGFTSSQMPINTGNGVIYISNAGTVPTTGSPVGGVILYGTNGQLWIKQSDATNFQIGSIPVPSTWTGVAPGSVPPSPTVPVNGTITYNTFVTSGVSTPVQALTFPMPSSTSIRLDIIFVGKEIGTGNAAQYNYSIGFIRNGVSAPAAVGAVTSSDPRSVGASWTPPTTTLGSYVSGNNIIVTTGSSSAAQAVWTVITQITVTTA